MRRFSNAALLWGLTLVVATGIVAVAFHSPARLDVQAQVIGAEDAKSVGRPNVVELQLTNHGSVYLQPVFSVQWDHYPFVWDGPSGSLAPHETRRIVISTETYEAMPPAAPQHSTNEPATQSVPFVVRVNTAGDTRYWASPPWVASIQEQPLVNGDFQLWSAPDFSSHGRTPIGWENYSSGQLPDITRVKPSAQAPLLLDVAKSSAAGAPDWAQAGISRKVQVDACPSVQMQMSDWPKYQTSDGVLPVLMAGLELFDESAPGRTLLVVAGSESRHYALDGGLAIWEQTPVNGALTADLVAARTFIGAGNSPAINVKILLSVHRLAPALNVNMGVQSVQCVGN